MSEEPVVNDNFTEGYSQVTSDDRLWAFLAYLLPLFPVIILLLEDKRDRPFIKAHNIQALVLWVVNVVIGLVLGWTLILSCIPFIIWLVMVYWGIQAYQGKYVTVPVITDFVRNQGWV